MAGLGRSIWVAAVAKNRLAKAPVAPAAHAEQLLVLQCLQPRHVCVRKARFI